MKRNRKKPKHRDRTPMFQQSPVIPTPLKRPQSKIFFLDIVPDLKKRFDSQKKIETIEDFVVDEIRKLLVDINTSVSVSGHSLDVRSKWTNKKVTIRINFSTGTVNISKGRGFWDEDGPGDKLEPFRKVMIHDEESFIKIQAIVNYLMG
jgi:hypothetical protein